MITFTQKGSFKNTERYLERLQSGKRTEILNRYGALGVAALSSATPAESGLTAQSWSYSIIEEPGYSSIRWHNSHVEEGAPIAVLLQYGHATRTGGYVQGRDYIMPAIRPLFDQITKQVWEEVTKV